MSVEVVTSNGIKKVYNVEVSGSGGDNSSDNIIFEECDYAYFDGSQRITLPYKITTSRAFTIDFQPDEYVNYMVIAGSTLTGNSNPHLTMYSDYYYTTLGNNIGNIGNNSNETRFTGDFTSRHVFKMNDNGEVKFDNEIVGAYSPVDYSTGYFTLASRPEAGTPFVGKIYGYSIYDSSMGENICNLVPRKLVITKNNNIQLKQYGLFDTISKIFYPTSFVNNEFEDVDYVHFNGSTDKITLPFEITETRSFIVDFQLDEYVHFIVIAGNTWGGTAPQLTVYNQLYYYYNGSSQVAFQEDFVERHVFNSCNDMGLATFDDTSIGQVSLIDKPGYYFTVGWRGPDSNAGYPYIGKIYKYTLMDNGQKICELVPKHAPNSDIYGLYDTINNKFYPVSSGGNLSNNP